MLYVRRGLLALLICLFLPACQMTVRLTTHVDADGSGTFTLQMTADKELRDQLAATSSASPGFAAVEDMFDGLRARGWTVTESEPAGGLAMRATRRFDNAEEFAQMLGDVRTAPSRGSPKLRGVGLNLSFAKSSSFLHETSTFHGSFDTSTMGLDKDIVRAVQGLVKFEIRAELPGDVTVEDARGSVVKSGAVWRPELGGSIRFAATSSSLRASSLMMILIPSLLLLAGLGWFAFGRRKHHVVPESSPVRTARTQPVYKTFHLEQIDRTIVLEPIDGEATVVLDAVVLDAVVLDAVVLDAVVLDVPPIVLDQRTPVTTDE